VGFIHKAELCKGQKVGRCKRAETLCLLIGKHQPRHGIVAGLIVPQTSNQSIRLQPAEP
jgi:hypothetical protein